MSSQPFAARPSVLYRLALAAVAVAMAVLPCVYVALTALAAGGVYLFATRYFVAIWAFPADGGFTGKMLISCTPLLVGAAITFAMVKPLFARREKRMHPFALNPEMEGQVYALVQAVCQAMGASAPRRIELTCDLNASASFERGWRGFFGRDRLLLTLGMPLVAGLTQRELAGVVAHEFGHFRQRTGMRVSYLIRRANGWFTRVIYERDGWDAFLASYGGGQPWVIWVMVVLAQVGVSIARGVLWLLMMAGHAVSAALMRQMEYDADRCETRLAGSAAFESTMVKLSVLDAVFTEAHFDLRRSWRRKFQLPDNLPLLVEYRVAGLAAERRATLEHRAATGKTGWLDTHPSMADRVRRARQAAEAGFEISDAPARDLFENFDTLSRLVTMAHYEDNLRVPTTPDFLIPLETFVQAADAPSATPAATNGRKPSDRRAATSASGYDPARYLGPRVKQNGARIK